MSAPARHPAPDRRETFNDLISRSLSPASAVFPRCAISYSHPPVDGRTLRIKRQVGSVVGHARFATLPYYRCEMPIGGSRRMRTSLPQTSSLDGRLMAI